MKSGARRRDVAENSAVVPLKFQEIVPVANVVKEGIENVLSMRTSDTFIT